MLPPTGTTTLCLRNSKLFHTLFSRRSTPGRRFFCHFAVHLSPIFLIFVVARTRARTRAAHACTQAIRTSARAQEPHNNDQNQFQIYTSCGCSSPPFHHLLPQGTGEARDNPRNNSLRAGPELRGRRRHQNPHRQRQRQMDLRQRIGLDQDRPGHRRQRHQRKQRNHGERHRLAQLRQRKPHRRNSLLHQRPRRHLRNGPYPPIGSRPGRSRHRPRRTGQLLCRHRPQRIHRRKQLERNRQHYVARLD